MSAGSRGGGMRPIGGVMTGETAATVLVGSAGRSNVSRLLLLTSEEGGSRGGGLISSRGGGRYSLTYSVSSSGVLRRRSLISGDGGSRGGGSRAEGAFPTT